MRTLFFIIILFSLTGCSYLPKNVRCECCERTFTNIDSALKCGSDPTNYKSLLFAFVSSDVETNQKKGWTILNDPDIIEIAKRDYVLIIIDAKKINLLSDKDTKELQEIINSQGQETFFVVTNRVFYPFRDFTLKTNKDKVISDLGLGEGP
jgi:hypothetical protein